MALFTVTGDTGMAECRAGKTRCVMAIDTILAVGIGRYVIREFIHTDHAVVA